MNITVNSIVFPGYSQYPQFNALCLNNGFIVPLSSTGKDKAVPSKKHGKDSELLFYRKFQRRRNRDVGPLKMGWRLGVKGGNVGQVGGGVGPAKLWITHLMFVSSDEGDHSTTHTHLHCGSFVRPGASLRPSIAPARPHFSHLTTWNTKMFLIIHANRSFIYTFYKRHTW